MTRESWMQIISKRARRLRHSEAMRSLVQENSLSVNDLIMPLFFKAGKNIKEEISSMPQQYRYSVELLVDKVKELEDLGLKAVSLFPCVEENLKTSDAKEAFNPESLNQKAIRALKEACPDILVMSDVALDPYNSDGHDGLVDKVSGEILNDETVEVLVKMALAQAQAGSDIIGPSDMMDGRVGMIRKALEKNGYKNTSIMAYTAKYASSFYGPFRDALDSAPKAGDKKTYQMNYANSTEALKELEMDINEGADIVMVKPGLSFLDIIYRVKQASTLPVAAYNVSGEYAMIMAASEKGYIDGEKVMIETLTSFKRAGADIILSYFSERMASLLKNS